MAILVHIAMFGWLVVVPVIFATMPARRAVIVCLLAGWLFLPVAGYGIASLPDYTKLSATTFVTLVFAVVFDARTFGMLRVRWFDLPVIVWCVCPIASSLSAGLGIYDGISSMLSEFITWGAPYLLGRAYFRDLAALRELAVGIFAGALVYLPLVAFEIRMSPQFHTWVYGYHQHDFAQARRGEFWRPTVFMQHGLAVSMFMGTAGVLGFWLWRTGAVGRIKSAPMSWLATGVVATAALCNSVGATVLMALGCAGLWATRRMRTRLLLVLLVAFPAAYIGARGLLGWRGDALIDLAGEVSEWRAGSLRVRLNSENGVLSRMGGADLLFGEGRFVFGGMEVEEGGQIIIPDAYWIIALVKHGAVGLAALTCTLLLPCAMCLRRWPLEWWAHPAVAPAAALGVITALSMIDNVFNAMVNPLFAVAAGGVSTVASLLPARPSERTVAQSPGSRASAVSGIRGGRAA